MLSITNILQEKKAILASLKKFFSNVGDYKYTSNDDKENKISILNEGAEDIGNKSFYPRIVLFRNGTQFQSSFMGDRIEGSDLFISNNFLDRREGDTCVSNYTLRSISQNFNDAENLASFILFFLKIFSKKTPEEINEHFGISIQDIATLSLGNVMKLNGDESENNALHYCDVSFLVHSFIPFVFRESKDGTILSDVSFTLNIPDTNC